MLWAHPRPASRLSFCLADCAAGGDRDMALAWMKRPWRRRSPPDRLPVFDGNAETGPASAIG